jgi:hypothetical protein
MAYLVFADALMPYLTMLINIIKLVIIIPVPVNAVNAFHSY